MASNTRNRNKIFDFKFDKTQESELIMYFNLAPEELTKLKALTASYTNNNAPQNPLNADEDDSLLYNGYRIEEISGANYSRLAVAFRYSTAFSPTTPDTPDPIKTSTGPIQPGADDDTVSMEFEGVVFPESYLHDILQVWSLNYGSITGFDLALLRGFTRNTQTGAAKYSENQWKFSSGTIKADDSWSPDDKLTRSFSLKATNLIRVINGAPVKSSLEQTLSGIVAGSTDKDVTDADIEM